MEIGPGIGVAGSRCGSFSWDAYWASRASLWFKVNSDLSITDQIIGDLTPVIVNPCYSFDGVTYLNHSALLDAYEVEFRIKTTSTARMGVIGVNGFGTIILSSNVIVAGTAYVAGNAAAGTYADGLWHKIKLRQTGTPNVFQIWLDDVLKTPGSSNSWRNSDTTTIGGASAGTLTLPLTANINRIVLRDINGVDLHKWIFCEGKYTTTLYDCVGTADLAMTYANAQLFTCDKDAIDYARLNGASLVMNNSGDIFLAPFLGGSARDFSTLLFGSVLKTSIDGILPCVSYGIDFNPDSIVDSRLDIFDRSDITIFNEEARLDYIPTSPWMWMVGDFDRIQILTWCKVDYKGRIFPKNEYHNYDKAYYLKEILITTLDISGVDETKAITYTEDLSHAIGFTSNNNVLLSVDKAKATILPDLYGGLYTRLYPSDSIGTIFENHGYRATFVILLPAQYRDDVVRKALFKDLQDRGHDVGLWQDASMNCIQLYDPSWADYFLALDTDYEGQYDEYGSPLWGIEEVFEYDGNTFLGLNTQLKYKITDAVILPIDGTLTIKILNIPYKDSDSLQSFVVLMPDDPIIPLFLRGRYIFIGPSAIAQPDDRIFPLKLFDYIYVSEFADGATFTNPGEDTLITTVGLDLLPVGGPYTDYHGRTGQTNNGANERARYYTYLHGIMAFEAMGLERPYTVGELRNIVDEICLSTNPLTELGYIAGGVDPIHSGHTFYEKPWHRWNLSTQSASATTPLADSSQSINFNDVSYSAADAFAKILQVQAKKKMIVERQAGSYESGQGTLWDDLLTLCEANNVHIMTERQAVDAMFDSSISPYANPIPLIHQDLNSDGTPDGFQVAVAGTDWAVNEEIGNIESGYGYFHRTTNGTMFVINDFGGMCPGKNYLKCYLKGKINDVLSLAIVMSQQRYVKGARPDNTFATLSTVILTFTVTENDTWQYIIANKPLEVYRNTLSAVFTASLVKGGTAGDVYCGQMFMSR